MASKPKTIKNVKIVYDQYKHTPFTTKGLIKIIEKDYQNEGFPESDKGLEHYIAVCKMFRKIETDLVEEGRFDETKFKKILDSGLLFHAVAGDIENYIGIDKDFCATLLNDLLNEWSQLQMTRPELEKFVNDFFDYHGCEIPVKGHEHNKLQASVLDCILKDTEVFAVAPIRYKDPQTSQAMQPDIICWVSDGTIVAIEVKRTIKDLKGFIDEECKEYGEYCNLLYVTTDNRKVVEKVKQYNQTNKHVGILFYDDDEKKLKEIVRPERRPKTKKTQSYIKKICVEAIKDTIEDIDLVSFSDPREAYKQINKNLVALMV